MPISTRQRLTLRFPTWVLVIGLFGIANFLAGCWFLLIPGEESRIYFWFAEIYSYTILPLLLFFPVSIIIVVLWCARFTEIPWVKVMIGLVAIVLAACTFLPAVGTVGFISTLRVIGKVKQNGHYYYLVSYVYDEPVTDYAFCESDALGFSGQCRDIASSTGNNQAKIYLDERTNLVTVESQRPSFIWTNSVPPKCITVPEENTNEWYEWYSGGCKP